MPKKSPKRIRYQELVNRQRFQATILFILFLGVAVECFAAIYMFDMAPPSSILLKGNESDNRMCHCYFWGCYCCDIYHDYILVADFDSNMTNVAVYTGCTKYVNLPADYRKDSIENLSCLMLADYLEHGRRCTGFFPKRCIYPAVSGTKATLMRFISEKGCPVSIE